MSIQTELNRLTNAKSAIKAAIEGKGVTVPDATLLDGMAALIESIQAGGGGGNLVTGEVTFESDLNLYVQSLTIDTGLVTATAAMIIAKNDSSLPSTSYIWILLKGESGLIKALKKGGAMYGNTIKGSLENGILNINKTNSYLPFAAGNQYFWAAWEA